MNKKAEYFSDIMKQILSSKKTKYTLYMVAVLWLAVATQFIVNRMFREDLQIAEAFEKTNTNEMQSSIEVIAQCNKEILSEADKKEIIQYLAKSIGLTMDREITVKRDGDRSEYSFVKQARQAVTEIKLVSKEQEEKSVTKMNYYIIMKLTIKQSVKSIDQYRKNIISALDDLKFGNRQITMQYEGSSAGKLTPDMKSELSKMLVDELHGQIAYQYDEGDLYTVYAYTGMIGEYITTMGSKINIQIAISYDEQENKTMIYLATPILNDNW